MTTITKRVMSAKRATGRGTFVARGLHQQETGGFMLRKIIVPCLVALGLVACRAHAHVKAGPVNVGAGAGAR